VLQLFGSGTQLFNQVEQNQLHVHVLI
jgi:hypothetical protein